MSLRAHIIMSGVKSQSRDEEPKSPAPTEGRRALYLPLLNDRTIYNHCSQYSYNNVTVSFTIYEHAAPSHICIDHEHELPRIQYTYGTVDVRSGGMFVGRGEDVPPPASSSVPLKAHVCKTGGNEFRSEVDGYNLRWEGCGAHDSIQSSTYVCISLLCICIAWLCMYIAMTCIEHVTSIRVRDLRYGNLNTCW